MVGPPGSRQLSDLLVIIEKFTMNKLIATLDADFIATPATAEEAM
jgi:hypothetical protein